MRGGFLVLVLCAAASCQDVAQPPAPPAAPPDPTVPRPAPVGALAQPPPAGAAAAAPEPRGLVGPTGTLDVEVYRARRRALMARSGGAAIVIINEASWDGMRVGMSFYWLTGIDEPGAALLLAPSAPLFKEMLFLTDRDVEAEQWNGERAPLPNKALEVATGIAKIERRSSLPYHTIEACDRAGALAYVGTFSLGDNPVLDLYRKVSGAMLGCEIKDLHGTLARLREAHGAAEIALMREAIARTAAGHAAALAAVRPGAREYEIKDALEEAFRRAGSRHLAFDSITGSGPNSAVLHYPKDDRAMRDGELIVVDIGAEAELYAADVTRTLPVGGRYAPAQREVMEIVLRAQAAGLAVARVGATIDDVDRATRQVIEDAGYYDSYLHLCCHYVGLQVHDVGDKLAGFVAGTVITIEPGIYLPQAGFGVRIEDQYLITPAGAECLTCAIPKTPDEIERAMAARR